jgi:hypothetical protein
MAIHARLIRLGLALLLTIATARAQEMVTWTGRVTDPYGAPLAGARVIALPGGETLRAMGYDRLRIMLCTGLCGETPMFLDEPTLADLESVLTDSDGRFAIKAIDGPPSRGGMFQDGPRRLSFFVALDGFATFNVWPDDVDGERLTDLGEIVLEPDAAVVGRVVDESGLPLQGVRVRVARAWAKPVHRKGKWVSVGLSLADLHEVSTDSYGRFRLPGLWNGRVQLALHREGLQWTELDLVEIKAGETTDFGVVTVPTGGHIEGLVLDDDGEPLEGATVLAVDRVRRFFGTGCIVTNIDPGDDSLLWELTEQYENRHPRATTDAKGRFVVRGVPGEVATLYAFAPGREPARLSHVRVGTSTATLMLREEATLLVEVLNADPDASIEIEASRLAVSWMTAPYHAGDVPLDVEEQGAGRFLIHTAGRAGTQVRVVVGGFNAMLVYARGLEPGEQGQLGINARSTHVLEGQVTAPNGQPIAGAVIEARQTGAHLTPLRAHAVSDAEGLFNFHRLPPAAWEFKAFGPAGFETTSSGFSLKQGKRGFFLELAMPLPESADMEAHSDR